MILVIKKKSINKQKKRNRNTKKMKRDNKSAN